MQEGAQMSSAGEATQTPGRAAAAVAEAAAEATARVAEVKDPQAAVEEMIAGLKEAGVRAFRHDLPRVCLELDEVLTDDMVQACNEATRTVPAELLAAIRTFPGPNLKPTPWKIALHDRLRREHEQHHHPHHHNHHHHQHHQEGQATEAGAEAAAAAQPPPAPSSTTEEKMEQEGGGTQVGTETGTAREEPAVVPLNLAFTTMISRLSEKLERTLSVLSAIRIMLQLMIPRMETDAQFGPNVMRTCLRTVSKVEEQVLGGMQGVVSYHQMRAKAITRALKNPLVEDYRNDVRDCDAQNWNAYRVAAQYARDNCIQIYDMLEKHWSVMEQAAEQSVTGGNMLS